MSLTTEEKTAAKEELEELNRIKDLLANAMKSAEKTATELSNAKEKSTNSLEIKTNEGYNGIADYSFKKRTQYNEYNTIGMQWAYSSSTQIGDRKVLYKPRIGKFVLVEATKVDVGFIELKEDTYKQLQKDVELYESNKEGNFTDNERDIDKAIHNFETGRNNNIRDNVNVGNRGERIQDAEVFEGKSKSNGTTDTKTTNGNLGSDFSLKNEYWHTGLTKAQIENVEKWVRNAGKPEATKITDTANWYKGRLDGKDLFVIYSTEVENNPTVMYVSKGKKAKVELDILMDLLEVIEDGESTVEIQRDIDALFKGDWVQEKYNITNNDDRFGERGSDTGYASVLQGESSELIGSEAFRNVITNLIGIQERKDGINHSLKSGVSNYAQTRGRFYCPCFKRIQKHNKHTQKQMLLGVFEV